jgi:hypothetical protein
MMGGTKIMTRLHKSAKNECLERVVKRARVLWQNGSAKCAFAEPLCLQVCKNQLYKPNFINAHLKLKLNIFIWEMRRNNHWFFFHIPILLSLRPCHNLWARIHNLFLLDDTTD